MNGLSFLSENQVQHFARTVKDFWEASTGNNARGHPYYRRRRAMIDDVCVILGPFSSLFSKYEGMITYAKFKRLQVDTRILPWVSEAISDGIQSS